MYEESTILKFEPLQEVKKNKVNYFRRVRRIPKGHYLLRHVYLSVCLHGKLRSHRKDFREISYFSIFSKICREKFNLI